MRCLQVGAGLVRATQAATMSQARRLHLALVKLPPSGYGQTMTKEMVHHLQGPRSLRLFSARAMALFYVCLTQCTMSLVLLPATQMYTFSLGPPADSQFTVGSTQVSVACRTLACLCPS